MSRVKLPDRIFGQWISAEKAAVQPGKMTWLRRTFFCDRPGDDDILWFTATGNCLLFINGRLIGFGPRPHPRRNSLYIEEYEISDFLEKGENVIAAVLIHASECQGEKLSSGLWCQAVSGHGELFGSDNTWQLHDGSLSGGNAPRFTAEFDPLLPLPEESALDGWKLPLFRAGSDWYAPRCCQSLEELPCRFELHPLSAPGIGIEHPAGTLLRSGKISGTPAFSSYCFRNLPDDNSIRGAVGWIFSDTQTSCTMQLHSDDPFRFFCNNILAASGTSGYRTPAVLALKQGWNRLLIYQKPRRNSMGMVLISNRKFQVLQDMTPEAQEGWCLTGPLHLPWETAAPSLHLKTVPVVPYNTEQEICFAQGELLRSSAAELFSASPDHTLRRGEFQVFDFGRICYGFPHIAVEAESGDTLELLLGLQCTENGLPEGSAGVRGAMTFLCRKGTTVVQPPVPTEFRYAAICIRRARNSVFISDVFAEELQCDFPMEGVFHCADAELNRHWDAGVSFLRRTSAFIPCRNGCLHNDFRLLKSYMDSANMAAVSGNAEYIATSLRQFLAVQGEDGSIPALTYSKNGEMQFSELFFLPVWIVYNYRFSGNRVELERAVEPLDRLREYFASFADDDGLLSALPARFGLHDELVDHLPPEETSAALNALYCRFLLSAAEVYTLAGDTPHWRLCHRQAQTLAAALRKIALVPEKQLLADRCQNNESARCDLVSNFCGMYAGITPLEEFEHFFHSFFRFDPPEVLQEEEKFSPLRFLFLEMLFALDQRSWALGYLRAQKQTEDSNFLPVNVFLLREVLGIRIAEPGHGTVFFNPACREMRFAEGVVPMARGRLRIRWELAEDDTLEVVLNSSVPVKVVPEMNRSQLTRTSFSLGGEVTLLKPPPEILEDGE